MRLGFLKKYSCYCCHGQDLHTIDLEDYKYSGTNITGLRLVDLNKIKAANLTKGYSSTSRYYNPTLMNPNATTFTVRGCKIQFNYVYNLLQSIFI